MPTIKGSYKPKPTYDDFIKKQLDDAWKKMKYSPIVGQEITPIFNTTDPANYNLVISIKDERVLNFLFNFMQKVDCSVFSDISTRFSCFNLFNVQSNIFYIRGFNAILQNQLEERSIENCSIEFKAFMDELYLHNKYLESMHAESFCLKMYKSTNNILTDLKPHCDSNSLSLFTEQPHDPQLYGEIFTFFYSKNTPVLILDNFHRLDELTRFEDLNRVIANFNTYGISVCIISRSDNLKENLSIQNYCTISWKKRNSSLRLSPVIMIRFNRRADYKPYMNVRFEKNEQQAWEIKSTKREEICETAIRDWFGHGLTAKEIQGKLKECYDEDISLASLSKLLLGLGLRRNRFHKRKKAKRQN